MTDLHTAMRRAFLTPKVIHMAAPQIVPQPILPAPEPTPLAPEPVPEPAIKPYPLALATHVIIGAVAQHFQITREEIKSQSRLAKFCRPRQIVMYLAHEYNLSSFPEIGRRLGRDHTTVLHAYRKIQRLIKTDLVIAQSVNELRRALFPQTETDNANSSP